MPSGMHLPVTRVARTQVHLGTLVSVSIIGLDQADSHKLINLAFSRIREIHSLMSFHEPDSDVSRLNREGGRKTLQVDSATVSVLKTALDLSQATDGVFDITVASDLVRQGLLPTHAWMEPFERRGTWQDIEIQSATEVRFRRPLLIDLGGIAKGYAVDSAIEAMPASDNATYVVNAGGDLRISGVGSQEILLNAPLSRESSALVISLENGSLASSGAAGGCGFERRRASGVHLNGVTRAAVDESRFVSVVSKTCVIADALTKYVLTTGTQAADVLHFMNATAFYIDSSREWQRLGSDDF